MNKDYIALPFRVWLVTGCSSGLGKAFVSIIAARGDKVIATARDINTLSDFANHENIRLLQLDVTSSREALDEAVTKAISFYGHVDVLVNNAGYVVSGVWEELSQSQLLDQFTTNVFGPLDLTVAFLPHMRCRGKGTVILMSSIAGWMGVAVGGPYSASKFALEGAAECLQKEVEQFGIDIHIAVLGQFRTNILSSERRVLKRPTGFIRDYDEIIEAFQSRLQRTDGEQVGDPVQAVERIFELVSRTGYFAGSQKIPFRIVLGSDAMEVVRTQCLDMLKDIDAQGDLGRSTDFTNATLNYWYK